MTGANGGQHAPHLPVDRDQLGAFVNAMFRHADEGTFASARTFLELEEGPPVEIRAFKLNCDPTALTKAMISCGQRAADHEKPCVFAPPVATFSSPKKAREIDLACGLALSVELDRDPERSRKRLEFLIGPATAVVASGGEWTNPETGEVQPKLHVHWRLAEPTRDPEAHARLKQARIIATGLVGGDCTNVPAVHPIRWPGSWHRKGEPKLCRIVDLKPEAEIDLHSALAALLDVQPEFRGTGDGQRAGDPGEDRETAELVRRVTTGEEYHAALRDLAWRYLKARMQAAQVVITLRGFMDASTGPHDDRWQKRRDQIPMLVRTAEEKIGAPAGDGQPAASEYGAAVARLAALRPAEYDKVRKAEAERLGVRVGTLDHDVAAARPAPEVEGEESGKGKALDLREPEPWPEPVDGAALIAGLVNQIQRFVVLSDHAALAAALWVLHAHGHDAAFHSPRLTLTSPTMRCGKSSLLRTIGRLIPRPLPTANITPSAMFRVIEAAKPCLLIDEADSFAQDDEVLRGVINSSHCCLDAFVVRTVAVGEDFEARRFSTWAPMAIASIGRVAATIADRSIIIRMERKPPGMTVARMRVDRDDGFGELASKAARWIADHFGALRQVDPEMPAALNDRQQDNWRGPIAIADRAGGQWPQKARAAALALSSVDEDADTIGVQLLASVRLVFGAAEQIEQISTENLLRHLHAMPEAPWGEYGRQRKPITPRQLASLLRPFGIAPGTIRESETSTPKGYRRDQFEEPWARYLAQSATTPQASKSASFGDFSSATTDSDVADRNEQKASQRRLWRCGG
jgi:hypothetical protein